MKIRSLDRWIIIQAVSVGILIFFLNIGPSGLQAVSVIIGALIILCVAALIGMGWAHGLVAMVVVLHVVILFTPITNRLTQSISVSCKNPIGDAIVVLEGDPGYSRILQGLRLYARNVAPILVVTGDEKRIDGWRNYEIATLFRINEDCLLRIETVGSGTYGEAEALRGFGQARGIRKIVLVTSDIHSLRAMLTFRKVGFEVCSMPAPERNILSDFWDPWGRVLMARDLVHECLGLIYYEMRGWI